MHRKRLGLWLARVISEPNKRLLALLLVCLLLLPTISSCMVLSDQPGTGYYNNVLPSANLSYNVGAGNRMWSYGYFDHIYATTFSAGTLVYSGNVTAHAASHENGGADEVDVTSLSGLLADPQTVTTRVNSGADVGSRTRLNFIPGANVTIIAADDPADHEVDITIDATAGTSATGNVTATGGIANYLAQFDSATDLVNSIMSGNLTAITVNGLLNADGLNISGNINLSGTVDGKDVSGLASVADIGTDANLSAAAQDAITKRHTQNTDTALGSLSANISANNKWINELSDPTQLQDAATKNYVDTQIAGIPPASGNITGFGTTGNMTKWTDVDEIGNASMTEAQAQDAVNKAHTQGTDTTLGSMSANVTMNAHNINDLSSPTLAQDAATKEYVDLAVAGLTGNVTASGGTSGYLSQFDASNDLVNSILTGNSTGLATTGTFNAAGMNISGNIAVTGTVDGKDVSALALVTDIAVDANLSVNAQDAITKKHSQNTDTALGTLTSNITMGSYNINGLATPTQSGDAATKGYVDSHASTTSGTHGVTGSIVGTTDSQTLTNKLLSTNTTMSVITEQGDILYGSAANTPAALAHGLSGQPLITQGHGANPAFGTLGAMSLQFLPFDFSTGFQSTVTGTGYDWSGNLMCELGSGATVNSTAIRATWGTYWHDKDYAPTYTSFFAKFRIIDNADDQLEMWIGWFPDGTSLPGTTENHYGFKIVSTSTGVAPSLSASNGAGAAETSTQLIASVSRNLWYYVWAVYGASDIKYYYSTDGVAWTLGATHTTNRPDDVSMNMGVAFKSTEAEDKKIDVINFNACFQGI